MVITPCPGFPLSPGRDPPSKLHRELNNLIRLASQVEQWIALPIRRRPPSHLNLIAFLLISQALSCRYEGGHHLNRIEIVGVLYIALPLISQALSCRYKGGHHLNRIASSRDCRLLLSACFCWRLSSIRN